ncbi:MAG: S41 family peptidase [Deltaproteobacteria bacterium]|nr:S41 family peptidase [Deltaproteobacteria bacterium]
MRKPWRLTAIFLFAAAILTGAFYGTRIQALNEETRESMKLYTELLGVARQNYGAEINYRDLVYASIQGMTRTLDPHTSFLAPQAYDGMRQRQQASFFGLGILVGQRNGRVTVITPIDGGPASRLGIRAGDIIDTIDGEDTEPMSIDDAVGLLKGPKGTPVTITVLRRGLDKPLEMTVIRAEIPQTTVRYSYMMTPDTGYMRITDFNRSTGQEVTEKLAELRSQGMKRLLIDLRNNGGGLLDQAIEVGELFVPKGTRIVETRGRTRSSHQTFYADERRSDMEAPIVVLVNSGTASAAEILAGAIQDHDIGIIAGSPTWGKGLVQTVYSLSYGAGLALTTAKYYTPSGRLIQRDYSSYYDYYAYNPQTAEANLLEGEDGSESEAPTAHTAEDTYETDLGRKVYGGGGITPDIALEPRAVSPFLQRLFTHNAFFDFAVDYHNRKPIKSEAWKPPAQLVTEFRNWLEEEEIGTKEELKEDLDNPETREFVSRQIHAEIFNASFGQEAWHRVLSKGDDQIQAALELFGDASELLASRQRLQLETERRASLSKSDLEAGVGEIETAEPKTN